MLKNSYITPQIRVSIAEVEEALLTISISDKEIDDNCGLVKESKDDWGEIWDE